jgi:hypothetical protein
MLNADMRRVGIKVREFLLQLTQTPPLISGIQLTYCHIPTRSATPHTILLSYKMRSSTLTALFFALFAILSTVAYAAPVTPQGAVNKRQCMPSECKDAFPAPSSSGPTVDPAAILDMITSLLGLLSPAAAQPPAEAFALTSTSIPTTQPTGI